jgi:hypothetical protein
LWRAEGCVPYAGVPIRCFKGWEKNALPLERKEMHWGEERSACELGRIWTANNIQLFIGEIRTGLRE